MDTQRDLYEQVILDHNRKPRNLGLPVGCNREAHGFNPLCNDEFTVYLTIEDGIVKDAGFAGAGCAISTASASLMTEAVKGLSIEQADALFESIRQLLTGDPPSGEVGKLRVLAGVCEYPMRVKCATLAWHTLHAALHADTRLVSTE
jgi:nitrogen fixation NifU-like protein